MALSVAPVDTVSARVRSGMRVRAALAAAVALAVAPSAQAATPSKYAFANRCMSLASPSGKAVPGASKLRFKATALGQYLLYRRDRRYLAAGADGTVGPAANASPAAVWVVSGPRKGTFTFRNAAQPAKGLTTAGKLGTARRLRVRAAKRCATYPEASLNARGKPKRSSTSFGKVGGIVEGHMHWMTFQYFGGEFHCGRPWHPYGIRYALPDCSEIEGPRGTGAPFQNTLNYGNPGQAHDTSGYPKLSSWSKDNLTYEGTYYRWIQRSYLGGLRLMVMGVSENRVLCELQAKRNQSCNEMTTVRRGFKALRELQKYVDAQAGGPGKGFFQIVANPYDARKVIRQGRMAVVLEIEVSEPFDCSNIDTPTCDTAQVDRQLNEMHKLGVRSMLLLNKFDNPLTGVRFDSGKTGVLINQGNKASAGEYWSAETCKGRLHDNEIYQPEPNSAPAFAALIKAVGLPGGAAPVYPPPPHCNTRGLTALGRHVVQRMMKLKMIVNPDHMSQRAVAGTLDELEKRKYSGVISPHGWMDPGNWPRIWKLGGLAFPGHSSAASYVAEWKKYRPRKTPYLTGWGYGADLGGLSNQPATGGKGSITYPFRSYDGRVTFTRQKTGDRTFDYTKEGVAQYGLYADWFADLKRLGGRKMADDMWRGAEAYLEMWERADGVKAPGCAKRKIRLRSTWRALLRSAGQPQQRERVWSWCGKGGATEAAELSRGGRVELAGRVTRGAGHSLHLRRSGSRVVFTVTGGGRRASGVATSRLAKHPEALRAAVRRLLKARATKVSRTFVPSRATASTVGRLTGRTLAGTGNPKLDAAVTMLCSLQVQRGAVP